MGTALTTAPKHTPYSVIDPFRRPDWRFNRIIAMCDRTPTPGRCTPRDDEYVKRGRQFLLRYRNYNESQRRELEYEDEDLYAAFATYRSKSDDEEGAQAFSLEARILSGQTDEEIAEHYPFGPRTVDYYEQLFFNVRDRMSRRDWMTTQILIPALKRDKKPPTGTATAAWAPQDHAVIKTQLDGSLKFFAYFAGPWVLEHMLTGFEHTSRADSPDEASMGWCERHFIRGMKRRAAQSVNFFEINKFNVIDVFMTVNQIIATEKSADSQEGQQSKYDMHVKSHIDGLPWTVGSRDEENVPLPVAKYDNSTSELRDDELLMVSAGDTPTTLIGIEFIKIPEGKPKDEILGPKAKKKDE